MTLDLTASAEQQATAQRVHGFFADHCPLYRTFKSAIAITTELAFAVA